MTMKIYAGRILLGLSCIYLGIAGSWNPTINNHVYLPFRWQGTLGLMLLVVIGAYILLSKSVKEEKACQK